MVDRKHLITDSSILLLLVRSSLRFWGPWVLYFYFSNTATINPRSAGAGNPERRNGQTGEGAVVVGAGLEAANIYETRRELYSRLQLYKRKQSLLTSRLKGREMPGSHQSTII